MRALSSTSQDTIASGYVPPMVLLLQMATTPVLRLNSTAFTVPYGGVDYLGAGLFGSVQPITESSSDFSPLKFSLSGVPTDAISLALQDGSAVKHAATTLSVALLDTATKAIVDVVQLFSGQIDQMPITYGPQGATISVTATHRGDTFSRPKPLRNTDGDQQKLYPGDTSRRFVVSQSQKQDVWPAASFFRQ
jgi:hypothetical protein